ncbi:hypothetical protein C0995_008034 [Termitomyces sp. Mi166|nr:hypothetical protein C0995_008034 [Termitomyces sp. Mi166\
MSEEPTYAWSNLNFNHDSDAPTLPNLDYLKCITYFYSTPNILRSNIQRYYSTSEYLTRRAPYPNGYKEQRTQGAVSEVRDEEKVVGWGPLPVNIMLAPPQIETTFSSGPPEQYTFDLSSFSDQQFPLWPAVVANPGGSFAIQNEPVVSPTDLQYYPGSLQQVSLPPPMPGNDALAWSQNKFTPYPESLPQATSDNIWTFNQEASLPAVPTPLTNTTPSNSQITTSDFGVFQGDALNCSYGKLQMTDLPPGIFK